MDFTGTLWGVPATGAGPGQGEISGRVEPQYGQDR